MHLAAGVGGVGFGHRSARRRLCRGPELARLPESAGKYGGYNDAVVGELEPLRRSYIAGAVFLYLGEAYNMVDHMVLV